MEASNEFINKSLSGYLACNLGSMRNNTENRCLKDGFFCGAVVVAVFVAPVEAIVCIALAIITSIALIGYYIGGDTGKKFSAIPVKFFKTALDNVEMTCEIVGGII